MPFNKIKVINNRVYKQHRKRRSYETELKALTLCGNHPFICNVLGSFVKDDATFNIILEEAEYGDLFSFLDNHPPSEIVSAYVGKSLILALDFMQRQFNLSHRDIKLENVVLTQRGVVQLIDFELCTFRTVSKSSVGTITYMAPELLQKKQYVCNHADMWSVGVTCFILALAKRPYNEPNERSRFKGDDAWLDLFLALIFQEQWDRYWGRLMLRKPPSDDFKEFIQHTICLRRTDYEKLLTLQFLDTSFNRIDMVQIMQNKIMIKNRPPSTEHICSSSDALLGEIL